MKGKGILPPRADYHTPDLLNCARSTSLVTDRMPSVTHFLPTVRRGRVGVEGFREKRISRTGRKEERGTGGKSEVSDSG